MLFKGVIWMFRRVVYRSAGLNAVQGFRCCSGGLYAVQGGYMLFKGVICCSGGLYDKENNDDFSGN